MTLPRRIPKKVRRILVFFVKFSKKLIIMQKNIGTKASPNLTFVKSLATLRKFVSIRNKSKPTFMKTKSRRKRREGFLCFST